MDFFRAILSDDPEPEEPDNYEEFETDPRPNQSPKYEEADVVDDDYGSDAMSPEDDDDGDGGDGGGLWSFGGLVKTLTSTSESVLETYRRDLKEFGSGLRKESDLFREVASRAVKELPSSIEVGASAIDGVWKSTAEIISQGKDALLAPSDVDDSDTPESQNYAYRGLDSRRYSRFDSQLHVIQNDTRTYCEDPEDLDDFKKWKLGFVLGDKKEEIENLVGDNGALEVFYEKLVPNEVDDGTFWYRYFYRVHKLKQQEDMRANLVKRSLSVDDEEELSWDVDDDEEEEANPAVKPDNLNTIVLPETEKKKGSDDSSNSKELHGTEKVEASNGDESKTESSQLVDMEKEKIAESKIESSQLVGMEKEKIPESKTEGPTVLDEGKEKKDDAGGNVDKNKAEEQKQSAGNVESVQNSAEMVDKSGKDSDKLAVSTQPPVQEDEDLEWDEIEDLGSSDEKKLTQLETSKKDKVDLRKRLSTAEDDEDLSWDIEDDEEPVKSGTK